MTNWIKVDNPYTVGKCPVEPYIIVDVKDRTGIIKEGVRADEVSWYNTYSSFDIVEYQIARDPKEEYEDLLVEVSGHIHLMLLQDCLVVFNNRVVDDINVINGELVVFYKGSELNQRWSTQGSRAMTQDELLGMFKFYKEVTDD